MNAINLIDVSSALRTCVSESYTNLVTRPTGASVRTYIHTVIDGFGNGTVTVLDFSHVGLLDFSCADEIVAKLLLEYNRSDSADREIYFLFRGISEAHLHAIEAVLARHDLALVSELADGAPQIVGTIDVDERKLWDAINAHGPGSLDDLAIAAKMTSAEAETILDALCRRRLVKRENARYCAVGMAA